MVHAAVTHTVSPAGECVALSAVILRTVKPPPHEGGRSSRVEEALDLIGEYG
jgi:hypothetical protein